MLLYKAHDKNRFNDIKVLLEDGRVDLRRLRKLSSIHIIHSIFVHYVSKLKFKDDTIYEDYPHINSTTLDRMLTGDIIE